MKRSDSSNVSPPERPTLFIDRNAWSNALHTELQRAGISHEAHRWHFGEYDEHREAGDGVWLRAVADRKWVVITRDKNIRYRANELAAMREAKLHVFVLTQGSLTAADTARLVVACYPSITAAVAAVDPPAFFSLTQSGDVRRLQLSGR